jgi:two-component system sensor histidine kinase CiaH
MAERRYMNRGKFLFKKQIRYVVTFLFIFTCIFSGFAFLVYQNSARTLFDEIDSEYSEATRAIMAGDDRSIDNYLAGRNIVYMGYGSYVVNHKIFLIMRNMQGEMLNADVLAAFDYIQNIDFSAKDLRNPRTAQVRRHNASVYYRTYSITVESSDGTGYYLQMVTDVTEIMKSLNTIRTVLLRGTVIIFAAAFIASWYLGQFLINSVSKTWEQQDEFISYASHLIRGPLSVIHNSLELPLQNPTKTIMEVGDFILRALSETSRLREITTRLMSMATLQSAEFDLNREIFDVGEVIEHFIDPFLFQASEGGKDFSLRLEKGMRIYADRGLIAEMCILLLENAIKYTEPNDSITFETRQEGSRAVIKMADTGIGIGDDAIDKVFTRFYREKSVRNTKDGSGLGLYIASLIAERHGGKIRVAHNMPKGTVFTVIMPNGLNI